MVQVKHQKIYSPLSIRKRALDYANRPEPKYFSSDFVVPDDLTENEIAVYLDEHYPDRNTAGVISSKRKGACIGNLTEHVQSALGLYKDSNKEKIKLSDEQKEKVENTTRLVISWLFLDESEVFGPMSRADLTPQQINALGRWSSEYKGQYPEGEWVQRPTFKHELTWIIYWAGTAWKWTVDALSIGEDLTFGDILQRYAEQTIAGENAEDYWNLTTMVSVEKAAPVYADNLKYEDDPGLPEGAVWCELCGEVMTTPGVPCKECQALGGTAEMIMQYPKRPKDKESVFPDQAIVEPVKVPETPQKRSQTVNDEFEPFAGLP